MCLGIPMQITAIDGHRAHCEAGGIEREVSLFLLQDSDVATGDYVLVHVGYAIQRLDPRYARETLALLGRLAGVEFALLMIAFPVSSRGTPAAGATHKNETVPRAVRCESCGATSE